MEIIEQIRDALCSQKVIEQYRNSETDWTRKRKLSFDRVATLILRGHKLSQQNAVNQLFREVGDIEEVATGSAYSQARQKLKPELFIYLNELVVGSFYRLYDQEPGLSMWRGRRLIGVDGSYLNMPDTKEMREYFSIQANQHEERVLAKYKL